MNIVGKEKVLNELKLANDSKNNCLKTSKNNLLAEKDQEIIGYLLLGTKPLFHMFCACVFQLCYGRCALLSGRKGRKIAWGRNSTVSAIAGEVQPFNTSM